MVRDYIVLLFKHQGLLEKADTIYGIEKIVLFMDLIKLFPRYLVKRTFKLDMHLKQHIENTKKYV